jgi:hypothetical protein
MVSIVISIVISKFLHCIILVTISAKNFFQQNFKMTRIQRGLGSWMLFSTVEKGLVVELEECYVGPATTDCSFWIPHMNNFYFCFIFIILGTNGFYSIAKDLWILFIVDKKYK